MWSPTGTRECGAVRKERPPPKMSRGTITRTDSALVTIYDYWIAINSVLACWVLIALLLGPDPGIVSREVAECLRIYRAAFQCNPVRLGIAEPKVGKHEGADNDVNHART
jgi:hypothetical protein